MRSLKILLLLSLATVTLAASSCKKTIDTMGVHFDFEVRKLSNGLQVIMVEDHTFPIVAYQTWYRVGSVDEKFSRTGIAHLFEHLMFKGTLKYGPKKFLELLEAKGSDVNAFTNRDYTAYHETFSPQYLEKVIDMESDRMRGLILDEEILKTERMVVFEERRLRTENSPVGRMQEALWQLAYRRHSYQWPVIGYAEDLPRIELRDLKDFYDRYYQPSNAVVVIVGDFKSDTTFDWIKKYYMKHAKKPQPTREILPEPEQKEERREVLFDEVASERFAMAYPITSALQDDSYALDVLANILFEGSSSRAYQRIVEQKDIAAGISGAAFTPAYPGLFMISGVMKGALKSEQVETELDRLFQEIQVQGVTQEEVQKAVKQLTVQLIDGVQTTHGLAQLIGTIMMTFGDISVFGKDFEKYSKVTRADVQRVALKYFMPMRRSVVVMKPGKSDAHIEGEDENE